MASLESGQVHVSVQPLTAEDAEFVIVTAAWKPPGQLPVTA
jgi:hypothetical protein